MSTRSFRVSVATVMLFSVVSLVGCDGGSGTPSAPTTPVANAGVNSQPPPPTTIKTPGGATKTVTGNTAVTP